MGAADTTPLDDSYCLAPADLCMENKWALWCFFGGILLAMISVVLLVNSVALHHKTLLDCERRRNEAAKAIRAANRSRRRRQELWEQEVYGGSYAGSNSGLRALSHSRRDGGPGGGHTTAMPHPADRSNSRTTAMAPSFESPARNHSHRPSRPAAEPGLDLGRVTPPGAFAPLDHSRGAADADVEMSRLGSPTSAPLSSHNGCDEAGGGFAIGAYTGGRGGKLRDDGLDDDATRISSWGTNGPGNTGAAMSWVAGEEDGGGSITPKTALRFKTSALSRAMNR
eukprot:g7267.t1